MKERKRILFGKMCLEIIRRIEEDIVDLQERLRKKKGELAELVAELKEGEE